MKTWFAFICLGIFVAMLALAGCGGGGGGTNGGANGGSNGGAIVSYRVEALQSGNIIDPTNIRVGETVQFVVAGFTANGTRVVQQATDWQSNDFGGSVGTLNSNGTFTATNVGGPFTVSATAGGSQRTGSYQVRPVQALVIGTLADAENRRVAGIEVRFYDSGGNVVGSSISQSNGTFRASVPTTAATFDLVRETFPASYFKQYRYNNKWYLPPAGQCRPNLPALTNNVTTNLGTIQIPATTSSSGATLPPPPPPTGCG